MGNLQGTDNEIFIGRARLVEVRLVHVFFLQESRNEWVNWHGDTDKVSRVSTTPHPSLAAAEARAEKSRIAGSSFCIKNSVAVALHCDIGLVLIYEAATLKPMRGVMSCMPAAPAVQTVLPRLLQWVSAERLKRRFLKMSCILKKDMPNYQTYRLEDVFYSRTSSGSGGGQNSLVWTWRPETPDIQMLRMLEATVGMSLRQAEEIAKEQSAGREREAAALAGPRPVEVEHADEGRLALAADTPAEASELESRIETPIVELSSDSPEPSVPPEPSALVEEAHDDTTDEGIAQQETVREQLALARVGQGLFRKRLEAVEHACRLTGLPTKSHLRASHIKPWRDSTDAERLDGDNGLLLSPHVDHLFDQGYISFADDGTIMVSSALDPAVLSSWRLDPGMNAGPFNAGQQHYLAHHRASVFRG